MKKTAKCVQWNEMLNSYAIALPNEMDVSNLFVAVIILGGVWSHQYETQNVRDRVPFSLRRKWFFFFLVSVQWNGD